MGAMGATVGVVGREGCEWCQIARNDAAQPGYFIQPSIPCSR
jgi:hypothetical protein